VGGLEWRMIGQILAVAAAAAVLALVGGIGAAFMYGLALTPIFVTMAGLGAALCVGLAALAAWTLAKAGPVQNAHAAQIPKAIAPGAWVNATLVGLVLVGSGGATAVGLNDLVWLAASIVVSGLYAVFALWPRRVRAM
jgi:hypothetical protein